MIHTADLQRSKRLKELGWGDSSFFIWVKDTETKEYKLTTFVRPFYGSVKNYHASGFNCKDHPMFFAPTAGEMIEWLLQTHDIYFQDYQIELIGRNPWGALNNKAFSTKDGNENALADACAWVKERKK